MALNGWKDKLPEIKGHILLWEEFCPQFPWVGPLAFQNNDLPNDGEATTNYLGEYWDTTGQIQQVHFRQFGWTVDGDDEGKDSKTSVLGQVLLICHPESGSPIGYRF